MKTAKPHGKLFVISGPSGVGKGTIIQEVMQRDPNFVLSISHSSRKPRANEQDGIDYFFVSRAEFQKMIQSNSFIEYAEVHGNFYGTAKKTIDQLLSSGKNVIFEVDIQGGLSLKKVLPEVTTIFILPPSKTEIIERIQHRGSETKETLDLRLQTMRQEMKIAKSYDYQVVNDKLDAAIRDILAILQQ